MKLEDQVCSLELAKKLKELGVEQESLWYWQYGSVQKPIIADRKALQSTGVSIASAFTVAELGEQLPVRLKPKELAKLRTRKYEKNWSCGYSWINGPAGVRDEWKAGPFESSIEANTRAKLRIHLIEKGVINV